jgi:hypothetical protein
VFCSIFPTFTGFSSLQDTDAKHSDLSVTRACTQVSARPSTSATHAAAVPCYFYNCARMCPTRRLDALKLPLFLHVPELLHHL